MDTATPAQPKEHAPSMTGQTLEPAPIDPNHDIDGLKTAISLVVSATVVFVSVWLLYHLFSFVMFEKRHEQVELAPTVQLNQLRTYEEEMLHAGPAEAGMPARRMSIEQAMQELGKR